MSKTITAEVIQKLETGIDGLCVDIVALKDANGNSYNAYHCTMRLTTHEYIDKELADAGELTREQIAYQLLRTIEDAAEEKADVINSASKCRLFDLKQREIVIDAMEVLK